MQCFQCGKINAPHVIYCSECGVQLHGEKIDIHDANKKYFVQTLVLFLCVVLIIVSSWVAEFSSFLLSDVVFASLLMAVTLVFGLLDLKGFKQLFRFNFHPEALLIIVAGAPFLALVVSGISGYMTYRMGLSYSNVSVDYFLYTSNGLFFGLMFVSVMPGLFEELLFRGILFNHLLKLTRPKSVILITGILFAFVHFHILSLLWLAPMGLFLGYLRFRYRSIVYCILFHMTYNAAVFFIDIYFAVH